MKNRTARAVVVIAAMLSALTLQGCAAGELGAVAQAGAALLGGAEQGGALQAAEQQLEGAIDATLPGCECPQ